MYNEWRTQSPGQPLPGMVRLPIFSITYMNRDNPGQSLVTDMDALDISNVRLAFQTSPVPLLETFNSVYTKRRTPLSSHDPR